MREARPGAPQPGGVSHRGINAGGNISVGGDVDASVTTNAPPPPPPPPPPATCAVTDELREEVGALVAAIVVAGLASGLPLEPVTVELEARVAGATTQPARIEHLLEVIERNALRITAIAVGVEATRQALNR